MIRMPEEALITQLNAAADKIHMTPRPVVETRPLGGMKPAWRVRYRDVSARNDRGVSKDEPPSLFLGPFLEVLALAIDGDHVRLRRVATDSTWPSKT